MARIEVPVLQLGMLCEQGLRDQIVAELQRLGFKFVTLDLAGFRSGSLNALIPADSLVQLA
jgi:uncharacterized protein